MKNNQKLTENLIESAVINHPSVFDEREVLHRLKHYLPAQAPLKDFVHHNTLHAFQKEKFFKGITKASEIFGYKVFLPLKEYRTLFKEGKINKEILEKIIIEKKGKDHLETWREKLTNKFYDSSLIPRIGLLRSNWKNIYKINLDSFVHPPLFRILCSYLDQGISVWNFPVHKKGLLSSIRELERNSFSSFFKTKRARNLLLENQCGIENLLQILVGDETLFEQYLFDQQFAHPGWSGMVCTTEEQPHSLLDQKNISLHDVITLELLFEIDALESKFNSIWAPIANGLKENPIKLFSPVEKTELNDVLSLWQEAFEWNYYNQVLLGIKTQKTTEKPKSPPAFQSLFCIDDREVSLRRYLEENDSSCQTFATPGFFGVEFYYKPDQGKFITKLCPAPVTPKYLIKEIGSNETRKTDFNFTKHSHSLFSGWLISQTFGFAAAFRLFFNIFRPTMLPATASSFKHMDRISSLTIENKNTNHRENDLQIGFTIPEMADRVEGVLKSIGLVRNFAPIIYVIGHGSSSVNNPHYSAYDCGACCGRPGSVNSRVFSFMANHEKVREILAERGIDIPAETQFMGGLHDTCSDDIDFFDLPMLNPDNLKGHIENKKVFFKSLDQNAKERSRRFESVNTKSNPEKIHNKLRRRSVSLFEPRPELNHATNALCIVGGRELTEKLFLDRRAFMNSYDYKIDPDGKYLFNILRAAAPVCGGINLEYYFSRVDNQKLGAGTKLPHNVMGLIGVANGADGDLRPGLPSQMTEVHDPVRLLIIVEQTPGVTLASIQKSPETYEWFINEWVILVVVEPETKVMFRFSNGEFYPFEPVKTGIPETTNMVSIIEKNSGNIPVYILK